MSRGKKTRVLIIVKTYPVPSKKYQEVVCTAGITEDGEWIRLYPIDYRYLPANAQFKKYQWIEVELQPQEKNYDKRKESRRPVLDDIQLVGKPISTDREWATRREIIDKMPHLTLKQYEALYEEERISLGIIRPSRVLDMKIEPSDAEWSEQQQGILSGSLGFRGVNRQCNVYR
jgi:hypothetical protein